jgi:hypothetical protein
MFGIIIFTSSLILIIAIVIYIIRNLLINLEKQEDIIFDYINFFNDLDQTIIKSENRLNEIDSKGVFKSDDEIGWFWVELMKIKDNISKFKTNNDLNENPN